MKLLIIREIKLAWINKVDICVALAFYMVIVTLFPLGLGPETGEIEQFASGAMWISLLLAVMLVMPNLYRQDIEDGTLEQWRSLGIVLETVVLAKLCAMVCFLLVPLLALTPAMALMLGLPTASLGKVIIAVSAGACALFCMGSVGAALMVAGQRQNSFLFMLLLLPLAIPVLIFGSAASYAPGVFSDSFMLLASLSCAMMPFGIWVSALLLRQAEL